jgi:hypothetical protein
VSYILSLNPVSKGQEWIVARFTPIGGNSFHKLGATVSKANFDTRQDPRNVLVVNTSEEETKNTFPLPFFCKRLRKF